MLTRKNYNTIYKQIQMSEWLTWKIFIAVVAAFLDTNKDIFQGFLSVLSFRLCFLRHILKQHLRLALFPPLSLLICMCVYTFRELLLHGLLGPRPSQLPPFYFVEKKRLSPPSSFVVGPKSLVIPLAGCSGCLSCRLPSLANRVSRHPG